MWSVGKVTLMSESSPQGSDIPQSSYIDLREHGIDEAQAAELRARLATFAEDWDSPEIAIYENYDAAQATHPTPR
jgi:hypothetical protein